MDLGEVQQASEEMLQVPLFHLTPLEGLLSKINLDKRPLHFFEEIIIQLERVSLFDLWSGAIRVNCNPLWLLGF